MLLKLLHWLVNLDRLLELIGKLPTTNVRIAVTLSLVIGTGVVYLHSATWNPSLEWLGFLAAMTGLDVTQFWAKRLTQKNGESSPPEPAKP